MRPTFSGMATILALFCLVPVNAQQPKQPAAKAVSKAPPKKATQAKPTPQPPSPPPPDLAASVRYVAGDKITKSTVELHDARQRIDYEADLAAIQQCDASRVVQLNTKNRTYLEMPFGASVQAEPQKKRKGGAITYTTTVEDTSERKDVFGFTARRLRTAIVKEASGDACDKRPEKIEIDGWYIDLPSSTTCAGAPAPLSEIRVDPKDPACRDEVTYVRPTAQTGYPVAYSMVTTAGTDAPVTTTMEVTELRRTTADSERFDVPADYVRVKTIAQLTADHRPGEDGPKKPGVVRIGVGLVANKSEQQLPTADLKQALSESLGEVEPDVVLLHGDTPAAVDADAPTRSVDYVLRSTVVEVKQPGKGTLGKLAGGSADAFAAKIEFALVAPGQAKPLLSASERSGTSLLQTAAGAAKRISQYFPPLMITRYGYLNAFTAMGGSASSGAMQQTQDPVLSTMFALVDRASGSRPQETLTSAEGAVAAAMEREVEAVVAELRRKQQ